MHPHPSPRAVYASPNYSRHEREALPDRERLVWTDPSKTGKSHRAGFAPTCNDHGADVADDAQVANRIARRGDHLAQNVASGTPRWKARYRQGSINNG